MSEEEVDVKQKEEAAGSELKPKSSDIVPGWNL